MSRTPVTEWKQLSALYEQAAELTPESLADWLENLRLQAHPLLPQIEQMLEARRELLDERDDEFDPRAIARAPSPAPSPAPAPTLPPPIDEATAGAEGELSGSAVGAYRLLRRLARGNRADVWLGERCDGVFEPLVAVKLLGRRFSEAEGDDFARRLERERPRLVSLHHPNIAGLHDAGVTPEGQAWLALEHVEGEPMIDWCDARRLDLVHRVRLFCLALMAVRHAHANLVVHGELQPGKILINRAGELRVLDFGVSKLIELDGAPGTEKEPKRSGGHPPPPRYSASPEQLTRQSLSTSSDVYSLGVVLYELLCGEKPYELRIASSAQLEHAILDVDPRAPSRREFGGSAARARSASVRELRHALAKDLDAIVLRALAKKPARRYPSVEALQADLQRWLEGRPVEARKPSAWTRSVKFVGRHPLGLACGALAMLSLTAVAVLAVFMGLQARHDSARALAARDFMFGLFDRSGQGAVPGAEVSARDLLDIGRRDLATRFAGQPELQTDLLRGIADTEQDMGQYAAADASLSDLDHAWSVLKRPRERVLTALDRAVNAFDMSRPDLARRWMAEARNLSPPAGNDAELRAAFANANGLLAIEDGKARAAINSLRVNREAAVQALGEDHRRSFRLGQTLARAERAAGEGDSALNLFDHLRLVAPRIQGLRAGEPAEADSEELGLLLQAGRYRQGLEVADEALPRCVQSLAIRALACRQIALARAQLLTGLGWTERAGETLPELRDDEDASSPPSLRMQALVLQARIVALRGEDPNSPDRRRAYERLRDFAGNSNLEPGLRAGALMGLAEADLRRGDPASAQSSITQARRALEAQPEGQDLLRSHAMLQSFAGLADLEAGSPEEAVNQLKASKQAFLEALGPDHRDVQIAALNLALARVQAGQGAEGLPDARSAELKLAHSLGSEAPATARAAQSVHVIEEAASAAVPEGVPGPFGRLETARNFFSF